MKTAVISDTHSNKDDIILLLDWLKKNDINEIIHLGDDYSDSVFIKKAGFIVTSVPGIYCKEYFKPDIPNRIFKNIYGLRCLITHTKESTTKDQPEDIVPERIIANKEVNMLLFGHSHEPDIYEENSIVFVNPGHMKKNDTRGFDKSFAIIEEKKDYINIDIFDFKTKKAFLSTKIKKH